MEEQDDQMVKKIEKINSDFENMKREILYRKEHLNKLMNENLVLSILRGCVNLSLVCVVYCSKVVCYICIRFLSPPLLLL